MNKNLSLKYMQSYRKVLQDYLKELSKNIEKEEELFKDFNEKIDRNKLGEIKCLRLDREINKIDLAIEEMKGIRNTIESNIEQLDKIIKRIEFNGYDHDVAEKRISNLHEYILDKMDYILDEFTE